MPSITSGLPSMHVHQKFEAVVKNQGLWEGLRFLNAQIPHRLTGVYRFDGTVLRNVALFDRDAPSVRTGDDFPMVDAPCARVGDHGGQLVVAEFKTDPRFVRSFGPIVSYCGALIRRPCGDPFGTLCHFDTKRCQTSIENAALLEELGPIVYAAVDKAA